MNKKGFSLLELIFSIAVITIIASVAIPKFANNIQKANITKLKNDVANIRLGLNEYKNSNILKNSYESLDGLDDGIFLFKKVISYDIVSSSKAGFWEKISDDKYKAWIDSNTFVEFVYEQDNYRFDCDLTNIYCKELTQ